MQNSSGLFAVHQLEQAFSLSLKFSTCLILSDQVYSSYQQQLMLLLLGETKDLNSSLLNSWIIFFNTELLKLLSRRMLQYSQQKEKQPISQQSTLLAVFKICILNLWILFQRMLLLFEQCEKRCGLLKIRIVGCFMTMGSITDSCLRCAILIIINIFVLGFVL